MQGAVEILYLILSLNLELVKLLIIDTVCIVEVSTYQIKIVFNIE